LTDAERRAYLAPNRWVQSDAPEVRDFARLNAGRGAPAEVMAQLVEAIRKHMSGGVDHLGYASATQALESRAGDCTEFSVLLAAGARHTDIAARWW
jgi:transglutaminase-like putative cysteine protease